MYCINCGKEIDENSKFCKFCGINFEEKRNIVKKNKNTLLIIVISVLLIMLLTLLNTKTHITAITIGGNDNLIESYEMIIRRHIKPQIGNIPLAELTSNDVRNFYNFLYADGRLNGKGGLAPKTVENMHLVLSSGINYALNEGLIMKNPLLTVKLRREGKKEIEVFSREEQQKIIAECPNYYYGMAIKFDFYTGLRAGELLS